MKLTLPQLRMEFPSGFDLGLDPTPTSTPRSLPRVEWVERSGSVLNSHPLSADGDILGLNLSQGCTHRCGFCSARAYPNYPGDDVVRVFRNTAKQLTDELSQRHRRPRAVYLSPSTDPCPPLAGFQEETARVVEVLASHGIESWLMTRGFVRPLLRDVLEDHRRRVKVTFGMTTLDRNLQRILEPLAAPPSLRLKQMKQLRKRGIPVQVALEPLVPGLTDTRENLAPLMEALAGAGIRHLTASYLFLRPGIANNLVESLEPLGWSEAILQEFHGGPVLTSPGIQAARYLSKARRQRGYATVMALAANLGITVNVCGLTNPDFTPTRRAEVVKTPRQRLLFAATMGQLRLS